MITGNEKETYSQSVFLLIVLSLLSAFFVYFPITDTDIWWHLSAAREMVARRGILYTDPFAFTLRDPQWIDMHWLFQLCMYLIYSTLDLAGLVVVKCLIIACVCMVLSLTVPDKRFIVITAAVYTVLIFDARYLVLIRPVLVTILCITFYLWAIEYHIRTRKTAILLMLAPVQIFWTNSQGLSPIGLGIAGSYLLGESMQRIVYFVKQRPRVKLTLFTLVPADLLLLCGMLAASSLVNPWGWQGFLFPFTLLKRITPSPVNIYSYTISENIPLWNLRGHEMHHIAVVIVSVLVVCGSFWFNKRSFRWAHLFLFGIFLVLAGMAMRNILLYYTVVPVIFAYNCIYGPVKGDRRILRWLVKARSKVLLKYTFLILILSFFFLLCAIQVINISRYPRESMVSPFRVPVGGVQFLKRHPVEGKMFNSIRYGGYLIWQFFPEKQVFIDGRLIIRSPQFFEGYLSLLSSADRFETVTKCYGITHVILPISIFDLYLPIIKWLYYSPRWDLVYIDGESVIFYEQSVNTYGSIYLRSRSNKDAVVRYIRKLWKKDPYIRDEAIRNFNDFTDYLRDF
jgi:hypothetical protein